MSDPAVKLAETTWIESVSQGATIATAVIALLALIIAVYQIRQSVAATREATATHLFNQSLLLSLQYPDFGDPPALEKFDVKQYNQYDWFVCSILLAAEEILRVTKGNLEWKNSLRGNLSVHGEFFAHKYTNSYKFSDYYDQALVTVVDEILADRRVPANA